MSLADTVWGAFTARQRQNEDSATAELQRAHGLMGIVQQAQAQQQAAQMRDAMAQSGGDPESALSIALKTGNVAAAHQLAPLVKLAQEERARKDTVRGLAELNAQQAAPAPAAGPQELGAGQPVALAGEDAQPAVAGNMGKEARRQYLSKLSALYANNPVVMQRLQGEIDRLDAQKPMVEHNFPVKGANGEPLVQPHISHDNGQTWAPVPNSAPSPKFARQVAPVVNVKAGGAPEPTAGLSAQYGSDETYRKNVDYWAKFVADGGSLPPRFAQSGSGKKMMPDILNVVPTISGGGKEMLANQVELTGQKAQARSVGTRSAAVEMAAGEAREMMPILLATSDNFKRTGYQPINQVFKNFQDKTGNVESRQFGAALNSFVNVYARAVSPSGVPTVSDKDHAREILSTADSHEQLVGLLKVLDQEMTAAQSAPQRVRAAQRSGITGNPATGHGTPTRLKFDAQGDPVQ